MENNRVQLLKDMDKVVSQIQLAKGKIHNIIDNMEQAKADGKQHIAELQEQLAETQEQKAKAITVESAQELVQKAEELKGAISLNEGVLLAVSNNNKEQLEELVLELLQTYTKAKATYNALEDEVIVTACIRSYEADLKLLGDYANTVSGAIGFASSVLVEQGIISQGTLIYKGHSISGRGYIESKLPRLIKYDTYVVRDLKNKGLL